MSTPEGKKPGQGSAKTRCCVFCLPARAFHMPHTPILESPKVGASLRRAERPERVDCCRPRLRPPRSAIGATSSLAHGSPSDRLLSKPKFKLGSTRSLATRILRLLARGSMRERVGAELEFDDERAR
jgi:hypothetical protein